MVSSNSFFMDTPMPDFDTGSYHYLPDVDPALGNQEMGHHHYRYRRSVLSIRPRVLFDPSNPKHMKDFARFVKYNNWTEGCNYLLEDPYGDIPSMIRGKIADFYIGKYTQKVK